jgi:hypothetical protein
VIKDCSLVNVQASIMGNRRIPDTVKQAIKRDLRKGDTIAAIVKTHKVSRGTVLRIQAALEEGDRTEKLKEAIETFSAEVEVSPGKFRDIMVQLVDALTDKDDLKKAKIGSREGAARAAVAVMEAYQRMYPPTMEEAAEWLITLPGFNAGTFASILRKKYGRSS